MLISVRESVECVLPKCLIKIFHHCPCPSARDFGSRVCSSVHPQATTCSFWNIVSNWNWERVTQSPSLDIFPTMLHWVDYPRWNLSKFFSPCAMQYMIRCGKESANDNANVSSPMANVLTRQMIGRMLAIFS